MMELSKNLKSSESNLEESEQKTKYEVITDQAAKYGHSSTFNEKPDEPHELQSSGETMQQCSGNPGSRNNIPFEIYEDEEKPQAPTDLAENLEIKDDEKGQQQVDDSRRTEESHEPVALRDQVEMPVINQEQFVFEIRRLEISRDITHDFRSTIFIWCPMELKVRPDFIATVIYKFNKSVNLRNRWGVLPFSRTLTWSGSVAEYTDQDAALTAIFQLTTASRYVKAVKLDWLLDQFMHVEVRHRLYGTGSTRIVVKGLRPLSVLEQSYWDWKFRVFGQVYSINFFPYQKGSNVICEVNYAYATQAQAAQMYLDGLMNGLMGKYSVQIVVTTKEREILQEVEKQLNICVG